jgi:hypothetical protein
MGSPGHRAMVLKGECQGNMLGARQEPRHIAMPDAADDSNDWPDAVADLSRRDFVALSVAGGLAVATGSAQAALPSSRPRSRSQPPTAPATQPSFARRRARIQAC